MNIAQLLTKRITGKIIIAIFSLVIFGHLFLTIFYLQDSRIAQQTARRDEIIQKIINTIYLVEATPIANRHHAVNAIEDPILTATFTNKPQWKLQFKTVSFWDISRALRDRLGAFAISIQLAPGAVVKLKCVCSNACAIASINFNCTRNFYFWQYYFVGLVNQSLYQTVAKF